MNTAFPSILTLLASASIGFAQGLLTPPGPPGPTMKTLDQIEARTPISSLPFTITAPGSYYLTSNLTGVAAESGITITTSDVTIDLNGFVLRGAPKSLHGITETGGAFRRNLAIRNGIISDWGGNGINGGNFTDSQFEKLRVSDCGTHGMATGAAATVKDCVAQDNNDTGIVAGKGSSVIGCTARFNTSVGITAEAGSTVTGCSAADNGDGFSLLEGSTAIDCTASSNTRHGFAAPLIHAAVSRCAATGNGGIGIVTGGSSIVTASTAYSNGDDGIIGKTVIGCASSANVGHGILVTGLAKDNECAQNGVNTGLGAGIYFQGDGARIEGNNCYLNDWGIQGASGTDCIIIRNSCRANSAAATNGGPSSNYDFPATNTFGPIIVVSSGDLAADPAASHPWANFSY